LRKRDLKMAVNNNGNLLDTAGNIAVDFVWGNFPLQPNDQRPDTATGRLDFALDNHVLAQVGWNGYPLYEPNTDGSAVDSDSPADGIQADEIFLKVPTVIGLTTALAVDALKDAGFATVTTATAASNVGKTITAAARTAGSAVISITCASHGFVAGNKVTVSDISGGDGVNGTWTVLASTNANVFTVTGTATTVQALTSLAGVVSGVAGTIKSVAYASGTVANQTTASTVTVTPYAAAS
jgi:hypothetical protein